ncbi:MAG TPA: isoprenylcysteine carboxylmethyltransferase family protein [Vicinamibacterales bacterium]|nr:isoprenylcysteine carboxylmethyltransferase family protein [Vicinamibacterales bacterium]
MTGTVVGLAAAIFIPMIAEALVAARHERAQLARGGVEPDADVYRAMRIIYPGAFALMLVELAWRGGPATFVIAAGALLFVFAKALKYWAIATLGPAWTFRVIVVPGAPLTHTGPYRFLRHPNYVAVAGELVGAALMTGSWVAGPAAVLIFGVLLNKRIAVEERALGRSL